MFRTRDAAPLDVTDARAPTGASLWETRSAHLDTRCTITPLLLAAAPQSRFCKAPASPAAAVLARGRFLGDARFV
ncbi:hypothetical protein SKAU_G00085930 [Synaphobranchus kaupii]|uniref:Uncharacterized protein n=1 Tax=Synaphobranchus kaupii TaxID=118154 RepID=A0A9Q1J3S1_SYNKA|nr:hypothetical protein SKAU_G00085930 [Synaphobranchus kaupii]